MFFLGYIFALFQLWFFFISTFIFNLVHSFLCQEGKLHWYPQFKEKKCQSRKQISVFILTQVSNCISPTLEWVGLYARNVFLRVGSPTEFRQTSKLTFLWHTSWIAITSLTFYNSFCQFTIYFDTHFERNKFIKTKIIRHKSSCRQS